MKGAAIKTVYLLKDLARITGYSKHTLKYYLNLGLIREAGRSLETRYRYFNASTVRRLKKIRVMRRKGWPIARIKHELLHSA